MKRIKFEIREKTLFIKYNIESNTIKNINNTNIISDEDLIMDIKYLNKNIPLVAGFLNVIVNNEKVINAVIEEEEIIPTAFEVLNLVPNIKHLVIKPDIPVDYKIHMAILKNDTLETVNCYTIPPYLLERIDSTKDVKIETRNEVFLISNFVKTNNLNNYSDVFYKRKITILSNFDDMDFKDFDIFLSINKYLKVIYFEYITMDLLKEVMNCIKKYELKNILINIKSTKDNLKNFEELEKYVKKEKYIHKNHIKFRIDYTKQYQTENLMKFINFASVKYILVVIIICSLLAYGLNRYDIYKSSEQVTDISQDINAIVQTNIESTSTEESTATEDPGSHYYDAYYANYSKVLSVLKQTNPDTVGWLTVNNTTVNYPVVQSTNNSYYLNHDFNRKSNTLGWVFMDYRNNPGDLDQNTIIYGHNIARAKLMFGNLRETLNERWYTNPDNQYIVFNTLSGNKKWRIFSIYKIPKTNDYLYSTFSTQSEFLAFADKMKSRSIYNFGVDIKENDKILTLSTCQTSGKDRLVIHAVLE